MRPGADGGCGAKLATRPIANFLASTDPVKNTLLLFPKVSRSFYVGVRRDRIENGDEKGLRRELPEAERYSHPPVSCRFLISGFPDSS